MIEMLTTSKQNSSVKGNIKKVNAGNNSLLVLTTSGKLYGRGRNTEGQLGQGTTTNVTGSWVVIATNVKNFWITNTTTLYQKNDMTWWYTGTPTPVTGVNSTATSTPIEITNSNFSALGGKEVYSLQIGISSIFLLDSDKNLYTCGANPNGLLFTGNTTAQSSLTLRTSEVGVSEVYLDTSGNTSYILYQNGTVKGAGSSAYGQLGSTTASNTLQTLATDAIAFYVAYGGYFIKKSDGLYARGRTFNGQLDLSLNGSSTDYVSSLTKITTPSGFSPDSVFSSTYATHAYWNGAIYYTGTNSGGASGSTSSPFNGILTVFSVLPTTQYPTGATSGSEIVGTMNGYTKYMLFNGYLYGTGSTTTTYDILPGSNTTVVGFKSLDTTGVVS